MSLLVQPLSSVGVFAVRFLRSVVGWVSFVNRNHLGGRMNDHLKMLCLALLVVGCATSKPDETGLVPQVQSEAKAKPRVSTFRADSVEDSQDESENEASDLEVDGFEGDGFCSDDIYATYLADIYRKEHKGSGGYKQPKRVRGKKARKAESYNRRVSGFADLAYAREVMVGREPSYFGAIPIVVNDRVDFWIQYFKGNGRKAFLEWLVRGESLKQTVQPILQERGVPMEFFYLAMIESGLSNSAKSHARATGTWQFMSGTAKLYGLKINHWVDERRDPVKSTVAAANLLKDLYAELGDWYLAMAAYNAGPGKVKKAMRRTGKDDFWELCDTPELASETKDYVPKVLAAVLLAADPKGYGFDVVPNEADDLPNSHVVVEKPVHLNDLAQKLRLPAKMLAKWNPEILRQVTPPMKGGYKLRLHDAYHEDFARIQSEIQQVKISDVQVHTVRRGDTLSGIARSYKVRVAQILDLNPDLKAARLKPGQSVAVPLL